MINLSIEDIEVAALQLSAAERTRLARCLLLSLEQDDMELDDSILASWVEEAERRGDAYDRGEMGAIDFDESIARARARIAKHRGI
ncbi:addiction module protein [Quatrionicoccus australiensis]|uniref:addiction module protein n=1 Tax=Quatrionicoccus australiensis TaxID=138118 RepID=UPI001CFADD18|nr:addiction module protein [Quatrionicoccus australiensis]MCB4359660.1 addiction module protein [Quatrionicoccus australiensis]